MSRLQNISARHWLSSVSGAAIATAVLSSAGAASAQDARPAAQAPNEVQEVVVTGFRSSLQRAIDIKRNRDIEVDTILAEDIGKFPDLNLSESIQRIPGVSITRDAGEGREISVRGLGPVFTRVRINGMEALTTTGSSDAAGGTNRGRSFDFNVFASDLFSAIEVRKTADGATEEGSLGATVDLRTARPFDYKGATMVVSAQEGYNDLAKKSNPRGAILLSNTWHDGMFGALVSLAYTKRQLQDNGTSTVRWATGNAFAPGFDACNARPSPNQALPDLTHCGAAATLPAIANPDPTVQAYNAAFHPRFPRYDQYFDDEQRVGGTVSLQFRPSPNTLLSFDALYADFKGTREEEYLEAPSFSVGGACTTATVANQTCGIAQTHVVSATIDSHNTMVAGTFNNVDLRVEHRFDQLDTAFTQYTFSGEQKINDKFKINGVIGHSKSDHDNPIQTTLTFDQLNVQGYSFDYTKGRAPLLNYGSANLTDPNAWKLTQIRERPQNAVNTYDMAEIDGIYDWSDNLKFRGGLEYKSYGFTTRELRRSNGTTANQETVIPAAIAAIPIASYSQVIQFNGSGLNMPAGTPTSWVVPNLDQANALMHLYDRTVFPLGPEPAVGNNRAVGEKDRGGYGQIDFSAPLGSMTLRGNLGIRYVQTAQTSSGVSFLGGAAVTTVVEHDYNDTLPSLNLVLEPVDNFQIRFAAAKVMSRPDLGNLTPGATVNVSGANRTVSAGNPLLDPIRAKSYDLSFEWYPAKGTLLSLALFHKDIGSFIQSLQSSGTFASNPFGLPTSVATAACGSTPGCDATTTIWTFTAPVNSPGGPVDGWEANYQQPLTFLPGFLSHTGLLLNYTSVNSSIKYLNAAGAVVATNQLTGLSRHSYNATIYYEDDRWSTRVSAAYRSKYLTRVPGQEAGTDVDGTNSTLNIDFSLQYTWNEHLKFTAEGVNLTDQFQDQFNDSTDRVSFYHHTGREFIIGVRYTH
jgi:iron complex outermembrane receptor protein